MTERIAWRVGRPSVPNLLIAGGLPSVRERASSRTTLSNVSPAWPFGHGSCSLACAR